MFDQFNLESVHAASIGQVHEAFKDNNKYAVKIQYPGVAESISSDLAIAKPLASRMFNMNSKEAEPYFKEVENKLLEETNYLLELEQSEQIAQACAHLNGIVFPKYYKKWSSDRILTMDWMDGLHLSEYVKLDNLSHRNSVGQALWDFYMYQIHHLKKVHADPHPGNFKVNDKHELVALDFGCMKTIPESFYAPYFELAFAKNINDPLIFEEKLYDLEILRKDDNDKEKAFFKDMFYQLLSVFTLPFQQETFDFSDHTFFDKVAELGEQYSKNADLKKMNANRGSEHFIYMNRTFFGLYQLMFDLKATHIKINNYTSLIN